MPRPKLIIRDAHMILRNFSGRPSQYNAVGRRNFAVILDPELAQELKMTGWNVRMRRVIDPSEPPSFFLPVEAAFKPYPPIIHMITPTGQVDADGRMLNKETLLSEDEVHILDVAEIERCDVVINPREWDDNGVARVKAYLRELYVKPVLYDFLSEYNY